MVKKFLLLAAMLIAIPAASLIFWILVNSSSEAYMATTFEKSRWVDEKGIYEEPYVRLQMIDDVIKNQLAKGHTRAQTIEALGEPTDTPYFKDFDLVYWLGSEKGFINVDSTWLVIKLNDQGIIATYKVVTD